MSIHESGEMYLETIYVLQKKNSAVRSVDISEHMGYSKPSVSRAVGLLKNGGYIQVDKDGYITLTESGRQTAEKIYERHMVLTRMLASVKKPRQKMPADWNTPLATSPLRRSSAM